MEDYKILQLAFIGRITGSGTAATGSGYWAVERLLTLPIGCDSCISSIIDWCFFGKSLVNGLQRKLIFTGCDTGATWRKRILAVRKWIFTGCKPFFLNSSQYTLVFSQKVGENGVQKWQKCLESEADFLNFFLNSSQYTLLFSQKVGRISPFLAHFSKKFQKVTNFLGIFQNSQGFTRFVAKSFENLTWICSKCQILAKTQQKIACFFEKITGNQATIQSFFHQIS